MVANIVTQSEEGEDGGGEWMDVSKGRKHKKSANEKKEAAIPAARDAKQPAKGNDPKQTGYPQEVKARRYMEADERKRQELEETRRKEEELRTGWKNLPKMYTPSNPPQVVPKVSAMGAGRNKEQEKPPVLKPEPQPESEEPEFSLMLVPSLTKEPIRQSMVVNPSKVMSFADIAKKSVYANTSACYVVSASEMKSTAIAADGQFVSASTESENKIVITPAVSSMDVRGQSPEELSRPIHTAAEVVVDPIHKPEIFGVEKEVPSHIHDAVESIPTTKQFAEGQKSSSPGREDKGFDTDQMPYHPPGVRRVDGPINVQSQQPHQQYMAMMHPGHVQYSQWAAGGAQPNPAYMQQMMMGQQYPYGFYYGANPYAGYGAPPGMSGSEAPPPGYTSKPMSDVCLQQRAYGGAYLPQSHNSPGQQYAGRPYTGGGQPMHPSSIPPHIAYAQQVSAMGQYSSAQQQQQQYGSGGSGSFPQGQQQGDSSGYPPNYSLMQK